jgi:hypothetical protein
MTLKEKFKKATSQWFDTKECEEIADKYAIDFAEWVIKGNISILERYPKETLRIYKTEVNEITEEEGRDGNR